MTNAVPSGGRGADSPRTLGARFAQIAAAHPAEPALIGGGRTRSYGELADEVARAAAALSAAPPGTPALVPAAAAGGPPADADRDHPADTVVQMLAVLAAGRPLVPIDAGLPAERIATISRLAATPLPGCAVLLFTSGSTGAPKAVRQGGAMWLHQVDELARELGIGPGRTVLSALPPSFGGGLDIVATTLLSGGTLVLADPRSDGVAGVLAALAAHAPHALHLSPHLLRSLVTETDAPRALAGLELVCTCGEAPDGADLRALRGVAGAVTYVNRAGSSETGNLAFDHYPPARPAPAGTLPPGYLAAAKHVVVRGDDGTEAPAGAVGRLEVHSEFLADGYLVDGQPVDFPVDDLGRRVHRLGDAGAVSDGQLRLVGRVDDAVKIRGFLVDCSEVTAAARSLPGIVDAVVVARSGGADGDRPELAAYLVPAAGTRPPAVAELRRALSDRLPAWMRPTHLMLLPALPRTPRGKVARAELPDPLRRPPARPPVTRTQRLLAPIWEDLLAVPDIGLDDDFTALGGDSLTAVTLLDRIDESFGTRLSLPVLTGAPTLAALATAIDGGAGAGYGTGDLVDFGGDDDHRPLVFAFAGAGESALAFRPLAGRLPDYRLIGLSAHALEQRGVPDYTIGRSVRRAAAHIRAIAPHGPYRFVGHSIGGVLAMETARLLEADGETVAHVVCLDTVLDDGLRARSALVFPPAPGAPAPATSVPATSAPAPAPRASAKDAAGTWRTRLALLSAGWWPRPAAAQWSLFHELGRRSALLHRLRAWSGPVTVILAEDNDDPQIWWPVVAPRLRAVHRVRGDHTAMLRPPFVTATAALIDEALIDEALTAEDPIAEHLCAPTPAGPVVAHDGAS